MIPLALALKEMEAEDRNGNRKPNEVVFATANREAWNQYKKYSLQLTKLGADDTARATLQAKIDKAAALMGGKFIKVKQCVTTGMQGKSPAKAEIERALKHDDLIRDPRHYKNKTRNIQVLGSGEKRKFHIKLLLQLNRIKVIH